MTDLWAACKGFGDKAVGSLDLKWALNGVNNQKVCTVYSNVGSTCFCESVFVYAPVQGVSLSPPPLIFMALGNPPLIRKSVSPRLMPLIKELS